MNLTTDEDDDDKEPTLADRALHVFTWPGYKALSLVLPTGRSMGDGCISLLLLGPVFLLGLTLFWGGVIAIVGNGIAFAITGRF